jgi:hypothetical protein
MLDEFQLAKELDFPTAEMSEISIKKRMRSLIGKAQVPIVKISREKWCIQPESVPEVRKVLWQSPLQNVKAPRTGNSGGRSKAKKSTNLQEYLTVAESSRH